MTDKTTDDKTSPAVPPVAAPITPSATPKPADTPSTTAVAEPRTGWRNVRGVRTEVYINQFKIYVNRERKTVVAFTQDTVGSPIFPFAPIYPHEDAAVIAAVVAVRGDTEPPKIVRAPTITAEKLAGLKPIR